MLQLKPLRRRGAAAAELAILLPFLVFLLVVVIDFCRAFYYSQTVQDAAYAGAIAASGTAPRLAAVTPEQAAKNAAVAAGAGLSPPLIAAQVTCLGPDSSNTMTVTVSYDFRTITTYPGVVESGILNLSRSARMRVSPVSTP